MSQATASLLWVALLFGLAIYWLIFPAPNFAEGWAHRLTVPFLLLVACGCVLENLRTRAHMGELVGALRQLMGKTGKPPTPAIKAEAVEILLETLRGDQPTARKTAAEQLRKLTGQDLGEDAEAWAAWWRANKATFEKGA